MSERIERRAKERPLLFSQHQAQLREQLHAVQGQLDAANKQVVALQRELTSLRFEQDDIQHVVAHDLRAPLRHIRAFTELVREDSGPTLSRDVDSHLGTITGAVDHMSGLIEAMMMLSHTSRVAMGCEKVPLRPLVEAARAAVGPMLVGRLVDWHMDARFPTVQGDVNLLQRVCTELVANAVKFSAPRERATIEIGASPAPDGWIEFFVRDNGVGFNASHTHKLFHLFARLHSVNEYFGVGAGLAMVKKIVDRHGGVVSISGSAEQGCCVSVRLPA